MAKNEIEEAKKLLLTTELPIKVEKARDKYLVYTRRLENENEDLRKSLNYYKGRYKQVEKSSKQIEDLKTQRDYYKARYLEFNNVFIKNK